MEPIWGRQDPGGPHIGPMNFAIWETANHCHYSLTEIIKFWDAIFSILYIYIYIFTGIFQL